MRHYFEFDGVKSSDFGVFISGAQTMGAAGRDVDEIVVPGMDGNLTIDNGRFNAVAHTYPAFIAEDAKEGLKGLRNALLSKRGHKRLSDTVHPDEFYRAYYEHGLEPELTANLRHSELEIEFTRDPRRFLVAGESTISMSSTATEKSGSLVDFDNASGVLHVTDAEAEIAPVQVGTPSAQNPCPISGWTGLHFTRCGANLFPAELPAHTIKASVSSGTIVSNNNYRMFAVRVKPNTTYYAAKASTGTAWVINLGDKLPEIGDSVTNITNMQQRTGYNFNTGNHTYLIMYATPTGFTTLNSESKHARVVESDMPHDWVANDGVTEAVDWSDDAGTVYGGTFNLATGVLSVTMGNIASYAGEPINEPWLSSLDEYQPGATPTTGAQVVYTLDAPVTYQLEPVAVSLLSGINSLYADCGDVTVKALDPVELDNPTLFPSSPKIRVYGQGTLYIGNTAITVGGSFPYVDIDTEIADCSYEGQNANQYVTFSGLDFPKLEPGENYVTYTGFSDVEITPRWWRL